MCLQLPFVGIVGGRGRCRSPVYNRADVGWPLCGQCVGFQRLLKLVESKWRRGGG